jgi:hypothetical protein
MIELKLGRLPDRTPAKITITVSAELSVALRQYSELYRSIYGEDEPVAELIPFMLEAILGSDRGFAKARKDGVPNVGSPSPDRSQHTQRRAPAGPSSSISGRED